MKAQVVAGIESAVDVAAGGMHTAVLDSNGKVCPLDKHQVFPSKTFKKCLLMGTINILDHEVMCFQCGPEWTVGINVFNLIEPGLDFWVQR